MRFATKRLGKRAIRPTTRVFPPLSVAPKLETTTPFASVLRAGSDCSGDKSMLCMNGTTCNADSKCRMPLGGSCGGNSSAFCQLGSQCEDNECRLIYGSDCLTMKKCLKSLICDSFNECRIPAGSNCSMKQDGCQAGATCSSNICQCQTTNCVPGPRKVGGTCTVPTELSQDELVNNTAASVDTPDNSSNVGQGSCDDRIAVCDRDLAVCECSSGSAPLRSHFTCGTGPGIACNETFKCASNLVCDESRVCAYHVGERCAGGKAWFCKTGTTCDVDGFCRYMQNEVCFDEPTMCRVGTTCDAHTHRCMVPAGSQCANGEECESGSDCRELQCRCTVGVAKPELNGQGCVPNAGRVGGLCLTQEVKCQDKNATCSDAVCKCRQDYIVDPRDFTCKRGLGASCTGEGQCGAHAFCDSDNKCSLQYGETCQGAEKFCPAGAICDSNHECKIKMNGHCSAVDTDNCESGTSCDWMHKCRLVVGQVCTASQACPVGAVCMNETCECDPTSSKQHNLVCEPLPGRIGSDCDQVARPCAVPGADCVAETCTCGATSQTTQEFGCLISSKAVAKEEVVSEVPFIVGLSVGVCVVAAVVAAAVYSRQRKNLDWVPETMERRQSLAELTELSRDILSDPEMTPSADGSDSDGSRSDTNSQTENQSTYTLDSQIESGSQYADPTTLDSQIESGSQYADRTTLDSQIESGSQYADPTTLDSQYESGSQYADPTTLDLQPDLVSQNGR